MSRIDYIPLPHIGAGQNSLPVFGVLTLFLVCKKNKLDFGIALIHPLTVVNWPTNLINRRSIKAFK